MKKILLLLTACCALIGCKKNDVRFTYSPEAPRAGQSVSFSNLSSAGEEWSWSFGDGATSSVKSPTHVFKQPGTYRVVLKVDNNNAWVATNEITVFDTVPSFASEDTAFVIYQDYTFTALVYNPYNYPVEYEWTLNDSVVSKQEGVLKCYFVHPEDSAEIRLRVTLNGEVTDIARRFYVKDKKTNSVLLRTAEGDLRQRIFGERAEAAKLDETATALLDEEQDQVQEYNGYTFDVEYLQLFVPSLQGFHIANRKLYYRADGLWVANIDGANQVQIDARECVAMTLDTKDNRIYWVNAEGVWYMPFVGSDNNQFVTVPTLLNGRTDVSKIAVDGNLK